MVKKGVNWHELSIEEVVKILDSDEKEGLGEEEAKQRLTKYGRNALPQTKKKTVFTMFLEQFKDFLVLILVGAALVSLLLGETTDSLVIIAILILNAVLGVVQESRANQALEALKKMTVPECEVIRGGKPHKISSEEIVPGDIVVLREGDFVPADLRLIEIHALKIDESSLTGESVPVEKNIAPLPADAPITDRLNMVYSGTLVTYGRGKGIVVATGMDREIGKIASLIQEEEETVTPLQKRLAGLGKLLGFLTLGICALVFLVGFWRGEPPFGMFMTAVSLAVAAIPEGLPAIVTVVLALGVYRMSQHRAIIRKLPAVETLGSTTYICTDKTGTLTENRMVVREIWTESEEKLYQIAVLCNDALLEDREGEEVRFGDPTELALLDYVKKQGFDFSSWRKIYSRQGEVPFDSNRKMMSTLHNMDEETVLLVKGAPDIVITHCSFYEREGEIIPLSSEKEQEIRKVMEEMAGKALRVLAFAWREMEEGITPSPEEEKDLIFVGFMGMIDPPRPEARSALEEANKAGITTVMITGDNPLTARAIAEELGMFSPQNLVITGPELANFSPEELKANIKKIKVFARVWPEQKLKIVEALQANEEVVAMTGDGVNDAPALKKADIGVAMGVSGTEVAKESADMILTDDNFATIVHAIKEGRVIFDNIRKFVVYLLSCNLGEIFAIFIPILVGWHSPLVPVQILLINLVTDGLPALALGMDSPEPDVMMRKPRHPREGIVNSHYMRIVLFNAFFITLAVVASFGMGLNLWGRELSQTLAFATLGFDELWRAYSFRSEKRNFWQINPRGNLYLVGACLLSFLVIILVILLPPLQRIFQTASLSLAQWIWVILFSLIPVSAYEIRKLFHKKGE
ncbi:MAG TPA: calcium-translocating P-type ATPase, SERCA-type [Candidatus Atribacteria bacterium]|nr:calcium-translocating P-type ATPase, SERCA-type [Candidatus Atribacteria bacterium]